MGALNRGCVENSGRVIGVIHAKWIGEEDMEGIDMVVVDGDDLQERKRQLSANADCLITLPGGVGTLDELFEAIAGERAHIISARIASCKLPRHVHSASCKGRPQHPPNLLDQHKRLL